MTPHEQGALPTLIFVSLIVLSFAPGIGAGACFEPTYWPRPDEKPHHEDTRHTKRHEESLWLFLVLLCALRVLVVEKTSPRRHQAHEAARRVFIAFLSAALCP